MTNIDRWRVPASVALIIVVVLGTQGFDCSGSGGGPTPAPTTGSISVSTGFGAVSNPPYQCTGSGNITVSPQTLTGSTGTSTAQTKPFAYSGYSKSDPPACEQSVIFTTIRTGTWSATNGTGTCLTTVTAGQMATVKIWNSVCQ
jgi:hypothetical protein